MEKSSIWAVGSVVALSGLALAVAHRFTIEAHASRPTPFALGSALDRAEVTLADGRALSLDDGALWLAGKRIALSSPRRFASLTVMPTGQVLVWGGIDDEGRLIETGEWFEPSTGALVTTGRLGLPARAGHTLNVLSDGTLAMTGGWGVGNVPAHDVALWRPLDRHLDLLAGDSAHVRMKSEASLLADGTLQIVGGVDEIGRPVHEAWRFGRADVLAASKPHGVVASYPSKDDGGASPIGPLALRFSEPVDVAELGGTVSLLGPNGVVKTRVVGAEDGRLAFVQLPNELYPAARYTIFVQGLHTAKGDPVPYEAIGFTTKAARSGVVLAGEGQHPGSKAPESSVPPIFVMAGAGKAVPCKPADAFHLCRDKGQVKDGAFYPGQDNVATSSGGHWRLYKDRQTLPDTKQLEANLPKGSTALIGQVRRIDESPVANVEISVDGQKVRTDGRGVFVLQHVVAGRRELFVDGRPAGSANTEYGRFIVGADVAASTVNHMPFVMYLPRVLDRDKIALPSPTTRETVLTHPDMPGLELRIPAGAVFKDRDGKVLNEIAIVPTPVDHAPFPLPDNFPMYFTIQPGDAVVQGMTPEAAKGIQVVYPNYGKQKPADKADFWVYSADKGWEMYGAGHVSADASQLVADSDTRLVWALGAGASTNSSQDANKKKPNNKKCGDPVDLQTGLFYESYTDLVVNDTMPLAVDRSTNDLLNLTSPFGYGSGTSLSMTLSSGQGFDTPLLVLSCGEPIAFHLISGQPQWPLVGTVWQHTETNSSFYGSTLQFLNDTTSEGAHWVVTTREGEQYWFERHTPNHLVRHIDRFGNAVRYGYDGGLLTEIMSPNGRTIGFTYNNHNLINTTFDQIGRKVLYDYHRIAGPQAVYNGYVLSKVTYPDGTSEEYTRQVVKDGDFSFETWLVASVKDRRGNIRVSNIFDQNYGGQVVSQIYADGSVRAFDYERGEGGVIKAVVVTDANGSKQRTEFDPISLYPSQKIDGMGTPLSQTTNYVRSASGLLQSVVDPLSRKTTYEYDALGNMTAITRLAATDDAVSRHFAYTPDSQLSKSVDELGHTWIRLYDGGCVHSAVDPVGTTRTFACDGQGHVTSATDAYGKVIRFEYRGGDLVATVDQLGRRTTFIYDAVGRRVARTSPDGVVSTWSYDMQDRVIAATNGEGSTTTYAYDGNGNVTEVGLPNGSSVRFEYDVMNRRIKRYDALGKSEKWSYDSGGRVIAFEDRNHQTSAFAYDELGRRSLTTYADGTRTQWSYDLGDRLVEALDTSAGSITWGYDDLDRLSKEDSASGRVDYRYDEAGRRTGVMATGEALVTYSYDDTNRLISVGRSASQVDLEYDLAGRRSRIGFPNGVTGRFGYNDAGQITTMTYASSTGAVLASFNYNYDFAGRRTMASAMPSMTPLAPASDADAAFDASNRVVSKANVSFEYDENGQLLDDGSQQYVWNARRQLTEVKAGGSIILAFGYDPIGRRITKEGLVKKTYLYDGLDPIEEKVNGVASPLLVGVSLDERLSRGSGSSEVYYLTDALGSTRALVDMDQAVTQRYDYDVFGGSHGADSGANSYLFTGREADSDDLYYYRARYYIPSLGQFISEDPLGFGGGQDNFYAYVRGNPVSLTDPLGLAVGSKYGTPDQAASSAIDDYLVPSLAQNREYAGVVYRNFDGTYSYTEGNIGTDRRSDAGDAPWFHDEVGIYHTHGAATPGKDGENFSKPGPNGLGDIGLADQLMEPNWLGTPNLAIKKYDPCTGKITILRGAVQ